MLIRDIWRQSYNHFSYYCHYSYLSNTSKWQHSLFNHWCLFFHERISTVKYSQAQNREGSGRSWMWVWKNNWKLISRGTGCNKQGEEKNTMFCLRRSTYSQLISSSYDQQPGSWRKEQTTELMRCPDNNSTISSEVNLLLFSCFQVVIWTETVSCFIVHWDAYILIRFIYHFLPKINKQGEWWGGCSKNDLLRIFKTMSMLDSTILVKLILPLPLNIDFQCKSFMAKWVSELCSAAKFYFEVT